MRKPRLQAVGPVRFAVRLSGLWSEKGRCSRPQGAADRAANTDWRLSQ